MSIMSIMSLLSLVFVSCSTSHDAVVQGGQFQFISPGGKTVFYYDPPEKRGHIGTIAGPLLSDPAQRISVDDYDGAVVFLNIWGQWCSPCRQESTGLALTSQKFAPKNVHFLGINFRDNRIQALDFLMDNHIEYPSIYDPAGSTLRALKGFPTSVLPVSIILDKQHRVAAVYLRKVTPSEISTVLNKLIQES